MNYIKRLERELQEARTELCGLRLGIMDLQTYLLSSKFHGDTRVQVKDVLLRIQDAERLSNELLVEQKVISAGEVSS